MSIDVLPVANFCHGTLEEAFQDPREIGCYSVDVQNSIHCDRSLMKYYLPRENDDLPLDLNVRYEETLRKPHNTSKNFNQFLKVIADSHFDVIERVDFITSRSVLQKLLETPYWTSSDDWMLCACRVGDVVYLKGVDTDKKIESELNATEEERRRHAWGFRFEAYMTADHPRGVPDILSTTHEIEKYKIVVTNKIGSYDLLLCAEVDGIFPTRSSRLHMGDPSCYVELKTTKLSPDCRSNYRFKRLQSLRWWCQSVVISIEDNVCGYRDDQGIVRSISNFKTKELPFLCDDLWNPAVCINFCNNFLKYLTETVENNPRIVYKLYYSGGTRISVSRLREPEGIFQVVPEWYLAAWEEHKTRQKIQQATLIPVTVDTDDFGWPAT